jgi:maltose alpha-D-glucosyltransferase / alpha-amylase
MVTDEERDYMYRAYAREQSMRVNLGIRRRLAPLLGNDRRLIELMNSLLFSLPGTPVLYYGDEIGMGDNVYLGDRNGVRTPMQWSSDRNAGFSRANPQRLYLPTVIDPEYHFESINVEAQQNNPRSLLWWMKRMIALRKRHPVFGRGSIEFLTPDNAKVLAYIRSLEDPDGGDPDEVLVVANLSRHAQACELDLSDHAGQHVVEMLGRTTFPRVSDQPYVLTLGPYQYHWFALERDAGHGSLSKLSKLRRRVAGRCVGHPRAAIGHRVGSVDRAAAGSGTRPSGGSTPRCPAAAAVVRGKARQVRSVSVDEVVPIGPKNDPTLVLLTAHVEYVDGEPEDYLVPVRFAEGEDAGRLMAVHPEAVLLVVKGQGARGQSGVLIDALTDPESSAALLQAVVRRRRFAGRAATLTGSRLSASARRRSWLRRAPPVPWRAVELVGAVR